MYNILQAGKCIGTTNLVSIDSGMGVVLGTFSSTPAYDKVRPVFRLYTQAMIAQNKGIPCDEILNAYFKKRDALRLSLETSAKRLIPVEWIDVVDLLDETGDLEVEVKLSDHADVEKLSNEIAAQRT